MSIYSRVSFSTSFRCPSDGYPFTGANNINGVDDGYTRRIARGSVPSTMTAPNAITAFQDAYVEKVDRHLNDLPNVLWIVSEEAPPQFRLVEQPPDFAHSSL